MVSDYVNLLFGELFQSEEEADIQASRFVVGVCVYVLRSAAFNPIVGVVRVQAGEDYGIRGRCDMRWPICSRGPSLAGMSEVAMVMEKWSRFGVPTQSRPAFRFVSTKAGS
ncbi:hypothetical protein ILYODFUR_013123 [Ilyodon furcidens]|uniref:Uncharacterized protein n=1 Tax=Ilyodon furcidens TaxID=33524 RepID=A0ABV0SKT9_9TELE